MYVEYGHIQLALSKQDLGYIQTLLDCSGEDDVRLGGQNGTNSYLFKPLEPIIRGLDPSSLRRPKDEYSKDLGRDIDTAWKRL